MGSSESKESTNPQDADELETHLNIIQTNYDDFQLHMQTAATKQQIQRAEIEFLAKSQHSTMFLLTQMKKRSASLDFERQEALERINNKFVEFMKKSVMDVVMLRGRVLQQRSIGQLLSTIWKELQTVSVTEDNNSIPADLRRMKDHVEKLLERTSNEGYDLSDLIKLCQDLRQELQEEMGHLQALALQQQERKENTIWWMKVLAACALVCAAVAVACTPFGCVVGLKCLSLHAAKVHVATASGENAAASKELAVAGVAAGKKLVVAGAAYPVKAATASKAAANTDLAHHVKAYMTSCTNLTSANQCLAEATAHAYSPTVGVLAAVGAVCTGCVAYKACIAHQACSAAADDMSRALDNTKADQSRLQELVSSVQKSEKVGMAIRSLLIGLDQDNSYFYDNMAFWKLIKSEFTGKAVDQYLADLGDLLEWIRTLQKQTRQNFNTWASVGHSTNGAETQEADTGPPAPTSACLTNSLLRLSQQPNSTQVDGDDGENSYISPGTSSHIMPLSDATPTGASDCFMPNVAFKSPEGYLIMVQDLQPGTHISLYCGRVAKVVAVQRHQRSKYPLTEVVTSQAALKVSRTHRFEVALPSGDSSDTTRLAGDLAVGDLVFVGRRRRPATRVTHTHRGKDRVV